MYFGVQEAMPEENLGKRNRNNGKAKSRIPRCEVSDTKTNIAEDSVIDIKA